MNSIGKLNKKTAPNGRFGAMAAVPRRQFCAKLHVIIPQQVQWKPPLRQAAGRYMPPVGQDSEATKSVFLLRLKYLIFFVYLCKKYNFIRKWK